MEYVEVKLTDAYCAGGCHRPLDDCLNIWVPKLAPKSLNIIGLMAHEKYDFIVKLYHQDEVNRERYDMEDLNRLYNIRLMDHGAATKWDAWKIE